MRSLRVCGVIRSCVVIMFAGAMLLSGCARPVRYIEHLEINARSAIIIDARTGETLYEKAPDKRLPPASTSKLLTAVVALESLPFDAEITVSSNAADTAPRVVPLRGGASYKLYELLAAILIMSGNDAAVAIAEAVAGSEDEFAELMNMTARRIGMNDSYFARASGLPTGPEDAQYTTSRDLAILMRYAMRHELIPMLLSRSQAFITSSDGHSIRLQTTNRLLLWDEEDEPPWGKTGYTRQARRTFVAVNGSRERRIVFALLGSESLWDDIRTLNRAGMALYE